MLGGALAGAGDGLSLAGEDASSLVEPGVRMGDQQARVMMARLLSYEDGTLDEAATAYEGAHAQEPDNADILFEWMQVLARLGQHERAAAIGERLGKLRPDDPQVMGVLAGVAALGGHEQKARQLFEAALQADPDNRALRIRHADALLSLGDPGAAVRLYRAQNRIEPDEQLQLKWARALNGAQRFAEAEQILRRLAREGSPVRADALLALADTLFLDKRFEACAVVSYQASQVADDPVAPLLLAAKALSHLPCRREEAMDVFDRLVAGHESYAVQMEQGKMLDQAGRHEEAGRAFEQARSLVRTPPPELQFYLAMPDEVFKEAFVQYRLQRSMPPRTRLEWARLYMRHNDARAALAFARRAWQDDPGYLAALREQAVIHNARLEYDEALRIYDDLLAVFPGHTGLMIDRARTLAWRGSYEAATNQYARVLELEPDNPLPRVETARTLLWGKDWNGAWRAYESLWTPSLDERLADLVARQRHPDLASLASVPENRPPFENYESITPGQAELLGAGLDDLYAPWRIQKEAWLESRAKQRLFRGHPARALAVYDDLLDFAPGNQEAWFDYGQMADALELHDRASGAYERLLLIDPAHNRARIALEKNELLLRPGLHGHYAYWREQGRGAVSGIRRHEGGWMARQAIGPRASLAFGAAGMSENPDAYQTRKAWALDVQGDWVGNAFWRADFSYRRKSYDATGFDDTDAGHLRSEWNLNDWARFALWVDRSDVIQNYFGMRQGIQADTYGARLQSPLTRRAEAVLLAEKADYNDDNSADRLWGRIGWQLTDHPKTWNVFAYGEWRDTRHEGNLDGLDLRDTAEAVRHPYWTPRNYFGYGLGVEWHRDLAREFFRGYDDHFINAKLIFSDDNEDNPGVKVELEWFLEWRRFWLFGLRGEMTRSREWDADGLWLQAGRRL